MDTVKRYKIVKSKSKWKVVEISYSPTWSSIHKTKAAAKKQLMVEAKFNFSDGIEQVNVYKDHGGHHFLDYIITPEASSEVKQ